MLLLTSQKISHPPAFFSFLMSPYFFLPTFLLPVGLFVF